MRRQSISFFGILFLFSSMAVAQLLKPVTFKFSSDKTEAKVGETIEVYFDATIQKEWYLYANDFAPDLGPTLTTASFKLNDTYELMGSLKAIHPKKKFDEIWGGDVTYFVEKGRFIQKVKILKPNPKVTGSISFQSCTDVDGRCVPGSENFEFNIKATSAASAGEPEKKSEAAITTTVVDSTSQVASNKQIATDTAPVSAFTPAPKRASGNLWEFLLLALGAGFISIFMPCIFPIMPMTVSFFIKQKNGQAKAVFYGLCIMLIFGAMGLLTMALGAPFLNYLSTHWLPNLIFFIVFILFGISLLGAFEIVLPYEAVNKIDRLSDRGGLVGIFFMALALVVVSFSCTVPFVGSLLILSSQGEVWRPLYGMLAFGLPFALVFSSLAMFPRWLEKLPKSGGWLSEIKAVFGFTEFALALKFLSNIDLTYHWNLIHRNIFILIWVVIASIITLYILGLMRLPKDKKIEKYSLSRIGFALVFFAFSLYMIPGVANKPLHLLSGILPPMQAESTTTALAHSDMKPLLHGLQGFKDYEEALTYSKTVGKPVLIDFTGYACANCRKMEEFVWTDKEVLGRLKNDFVIASLYVDDKAKLPAEKQYISKYDQKLKTTVGDKNMDLEITKFNNNAQPLYAIVDASGKALIQPVGYSAATEFIRFLDAGKKQF